jgi:hypothetical protein
MKKYLTTIIFITTVIFINSCKKDKTDCPTPITPTEYETDIYEFQLVDMGVQTKGYCGPIIRAYLDSTKNSMLYFKGIDLHSGISYSLNKFYKGRFKVLPEKYACMDGRVDPFPDQPFPTIYPNFVVNLKWELK